MTCKAIREGDQMVCGQCGLQWDIDDPDVPECRSDIGIESLHQLHDALEHGNFKDLPTTLARHSEQVDNALAAYNRLIEQATLERCAQAFDAIMLKAMQRGKPPEFPVGFLRNMRTAYPDKKDR